jgi:site-specific recombinase XerD
VREINSFTANRQPHEYVFLNRLLQPYKRGGIYDLVKRYGQRAALLMPSIADKQVSPHIIRHTTATHLLRGRRRHQHDPRLAGPCVVNYY